MLKPFSSQLIISPFIANARANDLAFIFVKEKKTAFVPAIQINTCVYKTEKHCRIFSLLL